MTDVVSCDDTMERFHIAAVDGSGLPLSIQFVGRYFDETTVFQVARVGEKAEGTDKKHPASGDRTGRQT